MDRGFAYITAGGLCEIVWAVAMKYSNGLADLLWSAAAIVFIVLSMIFLSKALASGMPVGTAYAVWVGIGAVGTFVIGIVLMNEPADALRMIFMMTVIAGIVGLQKTSGNKNDG